MGIQKIDFTVDEGEEWLKPSAEGRWRNPLRHFSCVTPAGESTSLTSRAKGMTTHTLLYTDINNHICMYVHTYSKSMDQPGKVANPCRGQLNKENEYSSVRVRA